MEVWSRACPERHQQPSRRAASGLVRVPPAAGSPAWDTHPLASLLMEGTRFCWSDFRKDPTPCLRTPQPPLPRGQARIPIWGAGAGLQGTAVIQHYSNKGHLPPRLRLQGREGRVLPCGKLHGNVVKYSAQVCIFKTKHQKEVRQPCEAPFLLYNTEVRRTSVERTPRWVQAESFVGPALDCPCRQDRAPVGPLPCSPDLPAQTSHKLKHRSWGTRGNSWICR